jgi:hypothetical protein
VDLDTPDITLHVWLMMDFGSSIKRPKFKDHKPGYFSWFWFLNPVFTSMDPWAMMAN